MHACRLQNSTSLLQGHWLFPTPKPSSTGSCMTTTIAKTKLMIPLTNLSCISALRETMFILHPTSTRYKRKSNPCAKENLINLSAKLNRKNQAQAKMFKPSSKPWGTNSTTKVDRCRPFTLPSKKEEQPLAHQLQTISEVKLPNGKSGILTLKSSRRKTKMIRNRATRRKRKRDMETANLEDIRRHSRDAWKSCSEWFVKTKRTKNTTTINTIGKKGKKPKDLKDSCCLFGVWVTRRRKSMSPPLFGIQDTKIFLPFHLVVMISPNKRQDRYWFGPLRMLPSLNTNTKVCQLELCALIGILHLPPFLQLVSMMELFWSMM